MGDEGPPGFADFVRTRYQRLARSAFLLTGDRGHAEDLVQSALVITLRAWDRLAAVEAAESYTRTTMLRLSRRWARRRWRGEQPTSSEGLAVVGGSTGPGDFAGDLDVRAVLAALPWDQRAVLVLRYFEDRSERDTAALLGIREGTVKSRASRALATLRESGLLKVEVHDG
jgi:RNA polymerase sigma-70 factor (sigma-E family)